MEQAKQAHHEKKPEPIEKSIDKVLYALIAIAVFATLAIIFIPNINPFSNKISYTGPGGEKFEIIKSKIGTVPIYTFRINVLYGKNLLKPYEIPLRNQPKTLKDISIDKSVKTNILSSKGIFITMDPELPEANQEIKIIYLKLGNDTKAYTQGNCVIIEAKNSDDLIKASEKTVLNLLNVM